MNEKCIVPMLAASFYNTKIMALADTHGAFPFASISMLCTHIWDLHFTVPYRYMFSTSLISRDDATDIWPAGYQFIGFPK
jgi:hypothetical protein